MCDEEHEAGKNGAFKAQKSKDVTLAIWFISQILNEDQAVIHFASKRIVTCYTNYLDNKNECVRNSFFIVIHASSSGSFIKHKKLSVQSYRTKVSFNPLIHQTY